MFSYDALHIFNVLGGILMPDNNTTPSVVVSDLGIQLYLGRNHSAYLKDTLLDTLKGQRPEHRQKFWALRNISFTLYPGDRLAILGTNGSGKSTLLKAISDIYTPNEGYIEKHGTLAPLLELGAGFNSYYNAVENIHLYGTILGYSRSFLSERINEIITFAELEDFADVPIKNYSSGMRSRLGFAICTSINPDILILDEVFAVGDAKFLKKSEERLMKIINDKTTVLFVSHSLELVQNICNKGLILQKGKPVALGEIDETVSCYKKLIGIENPEKKVNV